MSNKYRECVGEALSTMRYRQCVDEALSTMLFGKQVEQRWRDQVSKFFETRHSDHGDMAKRFRSGEYTVDHVKKGNPRDPKPGTAAHLIKKNHYLKVYPQQTAAFGLFRKKKLVGVIVFGNASQKANKRYGNVPEKHIQDLVRLVITDDVGPGAETQFFQRAYSKFRVYYTESQKTTTGKDRNPLPLPVVVSHSDPMPVMNLEEDEVVLPGHIGNIYQASSMLYTGRSSEAYRYHEWDGTPINNRSLSKIDKFFTAPGSRAAQGGESMLNRLGRVDTRLKSYIEKNKKTATASSLLRDWAKLNPGIIQVNKHPGNLVYVKIDPEIRGKARNKIERYLPAPDIETWVYRVIVPELFKIAATEPEEINSYADCVRKSLLFGRKGIYDFQPDLTKADIELLNRIGKFESDKNDPDSVSIRHKKEYSWWLEKLRKQKIDGNIQLWQDADWRGLLAWLNDNRVKLSGADILAFAKMNPYPKRPRQRYITLLRKMNANMSPGYADLAGEMAHELLKVWETLTDEEKKGLPVPPQIYTQTSCRVGSLSRHDSLMSVEQLLSEVYCG